MNRLHLTVCIVNYYTDSAVGATFSLLSRVFEALNIEYFVYTFLIVDNSFSFDPAQSYVDPSLPYKIIPGVTKDPQHRIPNSDHHARAAQKGLEYAVTNNSDCYMLCDPDIVFDEKGLISYLTFVFSIFKSNKRIVAGMPYHVRHIRKYRYYPSGHFLFFGILPGLRKPSFLCPSFKSNSSISTSLIHSLKKYFFSKIIFLQVSTSKDFGYTLPHYFKDHHFKSYPLTPFLLQEDLFNSFSNNIFSSVLLIFIGIVLPSRYTLIPSLYLLRNLFFRIFCSSNHFSSFESYFFRNYFVAHHQRSQLTRSRNLST